MKKQTVLSVHPFVIFWLGVLTGAIIVGLAFFYRVMSPQEYQSAITSPYTRYYNYTKPITTVPSITIPSTITPSTITPNIIDPIAIGDPPDY